MLFLHLLPGLLVLLIGLVLQAWPPRHINWFYGFRTHYSMRSPENWREGNRYYARLIVGTGVVSVLAGWLCHLLLQVPASILVLAGLMLPLFMGSILLTNEHLKRKYGNR
ncbi:SdpI family protein [Pontibacter actiniarum]|uniref:SdpI/YhfL protein family n=1 Tax=Pontibacter actiniarum TaxID=323450 RepID=A0A1X9YMK9_9BACT|nr:SdpI family protein [Pontibacter actiniarum]ARS34087.1 hypothetical protein CA264_00765 [Pontibacter actiniarum]